MTSLQRSVEFPIETLRTSPQNYACRIKEVRLDHGTSRRHLFTAAVNVFPRGFILSCRISGVSESLGLQSRAALHARAGPEVAREARQFARRGYARRTTYPKWKKILKNGLST